MDVNMRGIDLFSGGGCGSAGARHAGLTMVGAVDAWDVAANTYRDNFPSAKVVNARLTDRSGPEIFGRIGKIDMLIASPECTHHSIARGNRPVDQESQRSGWYVMKFIKQLDPRWIVLENVTPMKNWPGFDDLIATLKKTYKLRIGPLDASDFGTPQSRKRLFIVGDQLVTPTISLPGMKATRDASCILSPKASMPPSPSTTGSARPPLSHGSSVALRNWARQGFPDRVLRFGSCRRLATPRSSAAYAYDAGSLSGLCSGSMASLHSGCCRCRNSGAQWASPT